MGLCLPLSLHKELMTNVYENSLSETVTGKFILCNIIPYLSSQAYANHLLDQRRWNTSCQPDVLSEL